MSNETEEKTKRPVHKVYQDLQKAMVDMGKVESMIEELESGAITIEAERYLEILYPNPRHPKYEHWLAQLYAERQRIQNYLTEAQTYLKRVADPRRSLPKKQQRKLGLLPPL